jgi:hypothetical protein
MDQIQFFQQLHQQEVEVGVEDYQAHPQQIEVDKQVDQVVVLLTTILAQILQVQEQVIHHQ